MINGRGKKKKQSSDTQICFQFLDFFSDLWFLLKCDVSEGLISLQQLLLWILQVVVTQPAEIYLLLTVTVYKRKEEETTFWYLWIIWTFIEMKACEKFRGKNHYLVELLTTHRHVKCDPDYTLLFVRRQKTKRLETTGFIFNNVLYFKSLLYYPLCQICIWKVTKAVK